MADCKNHPGKNQTKKNPSPLVFNRSMTINSSSSAAAGVGEITSKPSYNNVYDTPASFQRMGSVKNSYVSSFDSFRGKVKKLCSIFESPKQQPSESLISQSPSPTPEKSSKLSDCSTKNAPSLVPDSPFWLPGTEDRVVIYFTSLRGIRRTFQDCHSIRMIFRGFRVNLDERDISLNIAYKKELQKVLGENNVSLPQVFIKGKYIGGADVVKQLLEVGELTRLLKGLPLRPPKPCDACDDVRFIPCLNCNGSRKVFDEDEEQPKRCPDCNENGLVRCRLCCS